MGKSQGDDWLGVPRVAERLGVTLQTVRALIDRDELAADFTQAYPWAGSRRRAIRIRPEDVDAFIARVRVKPGELAKLPPAGGGRYQDQL